MIIIIVTNLIADSLRCVYQNAVDLSEGSTGGTFSRPVCYVHSFAHVRLVVQLKCKGLMQISARFATRRIPTTLRLLILAAQD
jgi:hypothetical protein